MPHRPLPHKDPSLSYLCFAHGQDAPPRERGVYRLCPKALWRSYLKSRGTSPPRILSTCSVSGVAAARRTQDTRGHGHGRQRRGRTIVPGSGPGTAGRRPARARRAPGTTPPHSDDERHAGNAAGDVRAREHAGLHAGTPPRDGGTGPRRGRGHAGARPGTPQKTREPLPGTPGARPRARIGHGPGTRPGTAARGARRTPGPLGDVRPPPRSAES